MTIASRIASGGVDDGGADERVAAGADRSDA
jgi:hypothetical protein